ncbi:hypothetical protein EMIT0324P_30165 [Pseudomonas chlororaphis]
MTYLPPCENATSKGIQQYTERKPEGNLTFLHAILLAAYDKHGPRKVSRRIPAKGIVTLLILGITGPGDDFVATPLAFTLSAFVALVPSSPKTGAVDLDAADTTDRMDLGIGRTPYQD